MLKCYKTDYILKIIILNLKNDSNEEMKMNPNEEKNNFDATYFNMWNSNLQYVHGRSGYFLRQF